VIARRIYLEQVRGEKGRQVFDGDWEDASPGPHTLAKGRAQLDAVLTDLQTLAEPDRAALLMREQDQMPYEEIAAALGISAGAAKVKVHRARRKLAEPPATGTPQTSGQIALAATKALLRRRS
jgi:RNA polymerase sigma-70 factor (ECF subfamily)